MAVNWDGLRWFSDDEREERFLNEVGLPPPQPNDLTPAALANFNRIVRSIVERNPHFEGLGRFSAPPSWERELEASENHDPLLAADGAWHVWRSGGYAPIYRNYDTLSLAEREYIESHLPRTATHVLAANVNGMTLGQELTVGGIGRVRVIGIHPENSTVTLEPIAPPMFSGAGIRTRAIDPSRSRTAEQTKYLQEANAIKLKINSLKSQKNKGHLMRGLQRELSQVEAKVYKQKVEDLKLLLESKERIISAHERRLIEVEEEFNSLKANLFNLWQLLFDPTQAKKPIGTGACSLIVKQMYQEVDKLLNPPKKPPETIRRIKI